MDQLSAMRVFTRVVETGNFSKAALSLKMPKTTVTNLVQSLEAHLGTRLLNRTTRQVVVTTDGALYYERASRLLADLDELDGSLSSSQAQPSGKVRIALSGAFADQIIMPSLCDFHTRYPKIQLEFDIGDRIVDYIAENVDCALRGGTPNDQSLVARKVAELTLRTYAAPSYLEKVGEPKHPRDLEHHFSGIGYMKAYTGRNFPMQFHKDGELIEIEPRYIVSVNESRSYIAAAVAGIGVAQAVSFMVRDLVERGELVEILSDWQRPPIPLYIVYPQTRHLSNKVRVFVDWLAGKLQQLERCEQDMLAKRKVVALADASPKPRLAG
ncbi:transcriptional regulator, LysR family [Rhizobium sp. RU35A]|uniref:HTH-type transcriptional regulator TtuA n=1 Tax=Rhizobium straminoryzae TaxID=1387186 RepID=A0A549SZ79_9HYPH|nr:MULTISPECIES: LysR family transcriptional regulator [Rhizobium]TRL34907.1 LysR family transcriptional regulator [Rhizobium straminoryzae]SIQ43476.1 transcriptional regulator, LysR family [Rhizobium sp. RU35A]